MSTYYTVQTTNAFAALDLEDNRDRIMPKTAAPVKEEVPAVVPDSPKPARGGATYRGGRGGPRGGRGGTGPRRPREEGETEGSSGAEVVGDNRNTRGAGSRGPRGGRRGDVPDRENKRVFDKHSNAPRPKDDAKDVAGIKADEQAADVTASQDAYDASNEEKTPTTETEEKTTSVTDYFKSIQADVVVVSETDKVVDNQDLNKELGDAGYQPLGQTKAAVGGTAPGSSKMTVRKDTKLKQTNVFDKLGVYTSIRPKKKTPEQQKPKAEKSPKSPEAVAPIPADRKVLKDEEQFPSLF